MESSQLNSATPVLHKPTSILQQLSRLVFPRPDPKLPGPRGLPFLGLGPEMIHDSVGTIAKLFSIYGDTVSLPLPGISGVQTTDPELIQKALVQTEKQFAKGKIYQRLALIFGNGLVTNQGETWKQHRRHMDPLLTQRSIMLYMHIIDEKSTALVKRWQKAGGSIANVTDDAMDLTFEVLIESLFSKDIAEDSHRVREDLEILQEYSNFAMYTLWVPPFWLPTKRNRKLVKARRNLDRVIAKAIERRRRSDWPHERKDLISLLLDLRNEDGTAALSDLQIRDHIVTMYVAGHDTTAHTLSYTLYLLAKNPAILKRLRDHISAVFQEQQDGSQLATTNANSGLSADLGAPRTAAQCTRSVHEHRTARGNDGMRLPAIRITMKELKELDYLEKVINESMRLYPTAWSLNRIAHQDIQYGPYFFPKGTTFFMPQYLVHRHPKHWREPENFRPEHFDAEEVAERHKFAFFPFGGGPRNCIGYHLAMMELKIALVHLVLHFNFDTQAIPELSLKARITMSPNPPLQLRPIPLG